MWSLLAISRLAGADLTAGFEAGTATSVAFEGSLAGLVFALFRGVLAAVFRKGLFKGVVGVLGSGLAGDFVAALTGFDAVKIGVGLPPFLSKLDGCKAFATGFVPGLVTSFVSVL